mmetsp:Transcript_13367/g.26903  ORF Transcript_13367/g.26903 Transcript_13367/m.26903 type:complete len:239 (-) Transcript_13367:589-1305(-)
MWTLSNSTFTTQKSATTMPSHSLRDFTTIPTSSASVRPMPSAMRTTFANSHFALRSLHTEMHNNKIFDAGAAALGRALLENDSLEFLTLSSNGVGDEGAKGLAEGLRGNHALRRLDLYFNKVGDEGAIALAEALRVNRGLRALHLDTNAVGDPGGLAFAATLRGASAGLMTSTVKPSALGELTLAYNHLTNPAADAIMSAAATNEGLHAVALDHNHMLYAATKVKMTVKLRAKVKVRV